MLGGRKLQSRFSLLAFLVTITLISGIGVPAFGLGLTTAPDAPIAAPPSPDDVTVEVVSLFQPEPPTVIVPNVLTIDPELFLSGELTAQLDIEQSVVEDKDDAFGAQVEQFAPIVAAAEIFIPQVSSDNYADAYGYAGSPEHPDYPAHPEYEYAAIGDAATEDTEDAEAPEYDAQYVGDTDGNYKAPEPEYPPLTDGDPDNDEIEEAISEPELEIRAVVPGDLDDEIDGATDDTSNDEDALTDPTGAITVVVEPDSIFQTVGATWPANQPTPDIQVRVRSADDGTWSEWTHLHTHNSGAEPGLQAASLRTGTRSVFFGDSDAVQVAIMDAADGGAIADIELVLVGSPLPDFEAATTPDLTARAGALPGAAQPPQIITRAQWGARAPSCALDVAESFKVAVVHHTADPNNLANPAEAMQRIRNDQAYHMDSNKYCDIGYHFLVDPWGNIYEGRAGSIDRAIVGVHVGGFNTGALGVAMLGNFNNIAPSYAMLQSVGDIIGWRFAVYNKPVIGDITLTVGQGSALRYPNGTYVPIGTQISRPIITTHRDLGSTDCPGHLTDTGRLDIIRTAANRFQQLSLSRWHGALRYDTAAALAKEFFPNATEAFIATGRNFPDALAAAAVAGSRGAPVLLVDAGQTQAAVARLNAMPGLRRIYVVGGTEVVKPQVVNDIRSKLSIPGVAIQRKAGANRFDTAATLAEEFFPNATEAFIATGRNFPDALAAAAVAGSRGAPVLLVDAGQTQAAVARLNAMPGLRRVHIVGGASVVTPQLETEIRSKVTIPGVAFPRWYGELRYDTAAALAKEFFPNATEAFIATGRNFPDALAAAAVAGSRGAPVLLVDAGQTQAAVTRMNAQQGLQKIHVVGGYSVVTWQTESDIRSKLRIN